MDRKKLEQLIFDTCSVEPDYPWMDTPESAVFRHPGNRKWFALVTTVSRSKLGLPGKQPVDIVNLKCDPLLIGSLRMEPGFYPAYHMNKDRYRNLNLLSIAYVLRPVLRPRLTQSRSALLWKP